MPATEDATTSARPAQGVGIGAAQRDTLQGPEADAARRSPASVHNYNDDSKEDLLEELADEFRQDALERPSRCACSMSESARAYSSPRSGRSVDDRAGRVPLD